METEKPITLVTTYRDVVGYSRGLHEGRERRVLIAGDKIEGYSTVPEELAAESFVGAQPVGRFETALVYLGARGATPGFEYVRKLRESDPTMGVTLVACDCEAERKEAFAAEQRMPLIWSECGGSRTLARLVDELLR